MSFVIIFVKAGTSYDSIRSNHIILETNKYSKLLPILKHTNDNFSTDNSNDIDVLNIDYHTFAQL